MAKEPASASDLHKLLAKTGCVKFGVFKLKKKLSPYYLDLKLIQSYPSAMNTVISTYEDMAKNKIGIENFSRISGIPVAGLSFASILSYRLEKPFLYLKEAAKIHGREKKVDGVLSPGDRVLLVDDVVTSGRSILDAVSIIRGEGGTVTDSLVLIDREEGGVEHVSKAGVRVHSFTKISDIAKNLYEAELIDRTKFEEILKQTAKIPAAKVST